MIPTNKDNVKNGFTLIELLAVVGVVLLVLAIVTPALQNAVERARQVKCKSNLRNIGMAMVSFADDHDGHLPGCGDKVGDKDSQKSFIGKEVLTPEAKTASHGISTERYGTLLDYLPVDKREANAIYRCPSKKYIQIGEGEGSNSMFDYTMVESLAGGMLSRIPNRAVLYRNDDDKRMDVTTPLVVEESASEDCNENIEPSFEGGDLLTTHHAKNKGFYCSIDGSVMAVESSSEEGPAAGDWEVRYRHNWHPIDEDVDYGELPW